MVLRFRFGMRTLLAVVACLVVVIVVLLKPAVDTRNALVTIDREGGLVYYYSNDSSGVFRSAWSHFVVPRVEIEFRDTEISKAALAGLAKVHSIDTFRIQNDFPMKWDCLKRLRNVKTLSIKEGNDDIFDHIRHLHRLKSLSVSGKMVEGSKIGSITQLGDLRTLNLSYTSIGDDAMRYIGELRQLEELYLTGTPVSDIGIGRLSNLSSLRLLYINETAISPRCLKDIRKLTSLEELNVKSIGLLHDNTSEFEALHGLNLKTLKTYCLMLGDNNKPEIQPLFPKCRFEYTYSYKREGYVETSKDFPWDQENPFESVFKR